MTRILSCFAVAVLLAGSFSPAAADDKDGFTPLFNGKDLTGFYTYLRGHGKNNDPEKVFTVQDGMIRVTGKVFGCFVTEKEYENYHLRRRVQVGQEDLAAAREQDHGQRHPAALRRRGRGGRRRLDGVHRVPDDRRRHRRLHPGQGQGHAQADRARRSSAASSGTTSPASPPRSSRGGRINWYGRDPEWKDVLGFRGKDDVEKPAGQWNILECICDGDKITNILNGKVVNVGTKASHTKGKILFQSEGAEVFFRKIDLKQLKK